MRPQKMPFLNSLLLKMKHCSCSSFTQKVSRVLKRSSGGTGILNSCSRPPCPSLVFRRRDIIMG